MPALAGPGSYTAMEIPHNTTWRSSASGRQKRTPGESLGACFFSVVFRRRTRQPEPPRITTRTSRRRSVAAFGTRISRATRNAPSILIVHQVTSNSNQRIP
jgi:hypothetical protein